MTMLKFTRPESIQVEELSDTYAKIVLEPLEQGYGTTIGNALRRVMLSSIPGAAVTRVRFDNKYHEYETIAGVKEDVLDIILNIKELAIRLEDGKPKQLWIDFQGQGEVTGKDVQTEAGATVINPDHHLVTVGEGGQLKVEMEVEPGFGYRPAEMNKLEDSPLGVIPIDSDFSPVKRANFQVESVRAGERIDYDRLTFEIETNGDIKPEEALSKGAQLLIDHLKLFEEFPQHPFEGMVAEVPEELDKTLEELEFDKRACNLLKEAEIITLEDLLARSRDELLDIHLFGKKTLQRVEERLDELGYLDRLV
ncbi:MAG: DNA-directed RNA polymerase subunit alpha [Candidatus Bipolaricaulia bacterium]